jgi:hypothetical protein
MRKQPELTSTIGKAAATQNSNKDFFNVGGGVLHQQPQLITFGQGDQVKEVYMR